jgi:hypothetical protein
MIMMELPWLPPSANHAYFNLPRGGRALTAKGKKFKAESAAYLVRNYHMSLIMFEKNKPYGVAIGLFSPDLENATWPEKAATRYKRFDAGNRLKLIEDVLADVSGIDDSQHLTVLVGKFKGPEKTVILSWSMMEENLVDVAARFQSLQ